MEVNQSEFENGLLMKMLPEGYKYVIETCEFKDAEQLKYVVEGRVEGVKDETGVRKWLEDYYKCSATSFNIQTGNKDRKREGRVIFRGAQKCMMRVVNKEKSEGVLKAKQEGKNTECPAQIVVRIDNPSEPQPVDKSKKGAKVFEKRT